MADLSKPSFQYKAFISYRHADNCEQGRQWASWLHHLIETYEVPEELVGQTNLNGEPIPPQIYPVFRDETDLPVDSNLESPIYRALENSEFLVVICSPRAVESTYVAKEIQYFKQIGREEKVLAVIIDGEPNASRDPAKLTVGFTSEDECFPKPMQHPVDADGELILDRTSEPIAADFRLPSAVLDSRLEQGWTSLEAYRQHLHAQSISSLKSNVLQKEYLKKYDLMRLKILAGIMGVPLTELAKRDRRYRLEQEKKRARVLRLWLSVVGVLLVLSLVAGGAAFQMFRRAELSTITALREKARAVQNEAAAIRERNKKEEALIKSDKLFSEANVKLSSLHQRTGRIRLARAALFEVPIAYRDWEWAHSLAQSDKSLVTLFTDENIRYCQWSPDGDVLLVRLVNGTFIWYDAETLKERHRITIPGNGNWVSWTQDNKRCLADFDGVVKMFTAGERQVTESGELRDVDISPNGRYYVSRPVPNTLRISEVGSKSTFGDLVAEKDIDKYAWSPTGRFIAAISSDSILVWQVSDLTLIRTLKPPKTTDAGNIASKLWGKALSERVFIADEINDLAWHPTEKWLATAHGGNLLGSSDNTCRVWDLSSGSISKTFQGHKDRVNSVRFTKSGREIITGSWDGSVHIQKFGAETPPVILYASDGIVEDLIIHPTRPMFLTYGESSREIRFWNLDSNLDPDLLVPEGPTDSLSEVLPSPNGEFLLAVVGERAQARLHIWMMPAGIQLEPLQISDTCKALGWSSDSTKFALLTRDGMLMFSNALAVNVPYLNRDGEQFVSMAWSPVHPILATADMEGKVSIWEAPDYSAPRELRVGKRVTDLFWSPDGRYLAGSLADVGIAVWDAQTLQPVSYGHIATEGPLIDQQWCSSGDVIGALLGKRGLILIDAKTGISETSLGAESLPSGIVSLKLNPKGDRAALYGRGVWLHTVASRSLQFIEKADGTVWDVLWNNTGTRFMAIHDSTPSIWDASAGRIVWQLEGHTEHVLTAAWSPDSKTIFTGSVDGTIRRWPAVNWEIPEGGHATERMPLEASERIWRLNRYKHWQFRYLFEQPAEERNGEKPAVPISRLRDKFVRDYPEWSAYMQ